jgi:putative restriction endonuclease
MREVAPGHIVFSFRDTVIAAIGIARSYCYESPKPAEFGAVGANWEAIGWKTDVSFRELKSLVRPKDYINRLKAFLPERYAPLRHTGDGLQSVYLTEVSTGFAAILFELIGNEANSVSDAAGSVATAERATPALEPTLEAWEHHQETQILSAPDIEETERRALVLARRGQGVFRSNVRQIERACRVTRVERHEHLVASHIRPWRDSRNSDRLSGENGLLLTPTIDHLFDKGFISFEDRGRLNISPVARRQSLRRIGIQTEGNINVGGFSEGQCRFLDYHRDKSCKRQRCIDN